MSHDLHPTGHSHTDPHHADGAPHGTLRDYVTGFALSAILTAIPFWLVMAQPLDTGVTAALVVAFAMVQVVVHMVYFLHMSPKSDAGWTMVSLVFTIIVLVIAIAGTIWVMYNMDWYMMPGMITGQPAG